MDNFNIKNLNLISLKCLKLYFVSGFLAVKKLSQTKNNF